MPGPHPAVAATRVAVREALRPSDTHVLAAVSGGADSLALAAALAFECDPARLERRGSTPIRVGAVVVDHGLQDDSAEVAQAAAERCRELGLPAEIVRVEVAAAGAGGPEARARDARYEALQAARLRVGADAVLLGHTRDDQAEQVLLGLARGSGTRSLAGMPPEREGVRRPFLDLPAATTREACTAQGIPYWIDPHNADPTYLRVRARQLLADVEAEVPGVSAALARSAALLREDADALDHIATTAAELVGEQPWRLTELADIVALPVAVRRRVWRILVTRSGVPRSPLRSSHLADLDALVCAWRGQGPVSLPGGYTVARLPDPPRLVLEVPTRSGGSSPEGTSSREVG